MRLFRDEYGDLSGFAIVSLFVLGIAAFIGAVVFAANLAMATSCLRRWPDRQPEYSIWTGCTIVVEGQRIPEGNYRVL